MFLAMDAALRAADEPGLPALMQHLLARTDRDETAAAVRAWALEHELRTLYTSAVEGADMPAVAESLASLGFREVEGASDLDRFTSEGADVRLAASFRFRLPNSARR